jgi:hypothetical protein
MAPETEEFTLRFSNYTEIGKTMKISLKTIITLLGVLVVLDVVASPLAAHVTGQHKPPVFVPFTMAAIALLTLLGMYGLWRGASWARRLSIIVRVLDALSGLLGVTSRPSPELAGIGVATVVLSILVVTSLIRTKNEVTTLQSSRS